MAHENITLPELGWHPFFQQQLSLEELEACSPVRVVAVFRTELAVKGVQGEFRLPLTGHWMSDEAEVRATVGDWLLLDSAPPRPVRLLDRKGLFHRKAPGTATQTQLIAANVDTAFIVSSCNADFNLSRLERYLSLANEAQVEAVIVLTKADLCADPNVYRQQAQTLGAQLMIETVNALDAESCRALEPWCQSGQTITLLGSSGTGKSTLLNTLSGRDAQLTATIREDDAKGRHTTTGRSMHRLACGAWLIDTPGMRELQLSACEQGVSETFDEIVTLSRHCRFTDCRHEQEPGCAIRSALERGELEPRRLQNYLKLQTEQQRNSETLAARHKRERNFGKFIKAVQGEAQKNRRS